MNDEAALLAKAKKLRDETFIEGLRVDHYFHQGYDLDSMPDQDEIQMNIMNKMMDRLFGIAQPQEVLSDKKFPTSYTFQKIPTGSGLCDFIPSLLHFLDTLNAFGRSDIAATKYQFATLYMELIVQSHSWKNEAISLQVNDIGLRYNQWYVNSAWAAHNNCADAFALTGYCKPRLAPPSGYNKSTRDEILFFKCLWKRVFGIDLQIQSDSGMPSLWIYICFAIARERGWPWPWQEDPKKALIPVIPGRSYISAIVRVSKSYKSFEIMTSIFKIMEYTLWEYLQHFMLSGMLGHPVEMKGGGRPKRATNQQLAEIYSFFEETGRKIISAGGPKCFRMGLPKIQTRNMNYSLDLSLHRNVQRVANEISAVTTAARRGTQFNWANDFRGGIWVVADRYLDTLERPTTIDLFLRSGPLCANDYFRANVESTSPIFPNTRKGYTEQLFKQYPDDGIKEKINLTFSKWHNSKTPYPRIH